MLCRPLLSAVPRSNSCSCRALLYARAGSSAADHRQVSTHIKACPYPLFLHSLSITMFIRGWTPRFNPGPLGNTYETQRDRQKVVQAPQKHMQLWASGDAPRERFLSCRTGPVGHAEDELVLSPSLLLHPLPRLHPLSPSLPPSQVPQGVKPVQRIHIICNIQYVWIS